MTSRRVRREPFRTTDADGKAIVRVPLARGNASARIYPDDFDNLMRVGVSDQWTLNETGTGHAYVRCARSDVTGQLETVARLIMQPGPGRIVCYRDGDRLNLRRDNLYCTSGRAKGREGLPLLSEEPGRLAA